MRAQHKVNISFIVSFTFLLKPATGKRERLIIFGWCSSCVAKLFDAQCIMWHVKDRHFSFIIHIKHIKQTKSVFNEQTHICYQSLQQTCCHSRCFGGVAVFSSQVAWRALACVLAIILQNVMAFVHMFGCYGFLCIENEIFGGALTRAGKWTYCKYSAQPSV